MPCKFWGSVLKKNMLISLKNNNIYPKAEFEIFLFTNTLNITTKTKLQQQKHEQSLFISFRF